MLACENLEVSFGGPPVLKGVTVDFPPKQITAIIGPSGCGKSTLLRSFNRMHDLTLGAKVQGRVTLNGRDLYGEGVDPVSVRRSIGMVFQKPNPFPTMSIFENTVAGLRLAGIGNKHRLREVAEQALKDAALWDEVHNRLDTSALNLSGGQQQRLCIARSLAVEPEILLMDEPCSALDPIATQRIEDLMARLTEKLTLIIVTHNLQQAARVSDRTVFMWMGELIEVGETAKMVLKPQKKLTEDYLTGRFG
jgi:phosphate transport system ATP-binding protein